MRLIPKWAKKTMPKKFRRGIEQFVRDQKLGIELIRLNSGISRFHDHQTHLDAIKYIQSKDLEFVETANNRIKELQNGFDQFVKSKSLENFYQFEENSAKAREALKNLLEKNPRAFYFLYDIKGLEHMNMVKYIDRIMDDYLEMARRFKTKYKI